MPMKKGPIHSATCHHHETRFGLWFSVPCSEMLLSTIRNMKSDIEIQVETSSICIKQEENLPNETAAQYF